MHAENEQENKSESFTNETTQSEGAAEATFQLLDSRPEAIQMQQMQELANNSSQVAGIVQLQAMADNFTVQKQPIQRQENKTGLPDNLKSGMENLTGHSMDDVKVHRNSDQPAQLNAHAYAQGTDIHLGPGQEKHLAHELGHVVQQKEGRVKPTKQLKGKVPVNDDAGLEKEADVLGAKALQMKAEDSTQLKSIDNISSATYQLHQPGKMEMAERVDKKRKIKEGEEAAGLAVNDSLGKANENGEREEKLEYLKSLGGEDIKTRLADQKKMVSDHNHIDPMEINPETLDEKLLATLAAREAGEFKDQTIWERIGKGKWKETITSDKEKIKEAQKKIPHYSEYLNEDAINAHLGKFANGGHAFVPVWAHSRIMGTVFHQYFSGWGDGEIFLAPVEEGNAIHEEATKDKGITTLEEKCGLKPKAWSEGSDRKMMRYFVPQFNVKNISDDKAKYVIELATGQENGAHPHFWNAGGMTTGGLSEGIIKAMDRKSLLMAISENEVIQEQVTYAKTPEEALTK